MSSVHKSFIREILKAAVDPEIISFAGGLPNPRFFPSARLQEASRKVLSEQGGAALQYAATEGFPPLREKIAERYAARGTRVRPEEILVLNGSQQGLDLTAKIFIDSGDTVLVERPSYLAALQCFGFFEPCFKSLPLETEGVCTKDLSESLKDPRARLFYAIPNFQNPSGVSYSAARRVEIGRLMASSSTVLLEDDPYGELRFMGSPAPSLWTCVREAGGCPDSSILLGTFSKIVSPGMRLGWICAGEAVREQLIIAKQAADLQSNELSQRIVHRYLCDNDVEEHIETIRAAYRTQRDAMVAAVRALFPREVTCTEPEGGMFLWMTLPTGMSSLAFFEKALERKVTFVPGQAFYAGPGGENTLRLNFSNTDTCDIEKGMKVLSEVYASMA